MSANSASHTDVSVWDRIIGQDDAVTRLRAAASRPVHAYLFVGPAGVGKAVAARAFASQLIAGIDDPHHRDVDLVVRGEHPDVAEVVRTGPTISAEQAREIVRTASLAPVEGPRKVLILHEFHLLRPEGAAILLKTIEEPPPSTTIIVLADFVPNDLITVSSRCARIDFHPVSDDVVAAALVADGVDEADAFVAAEASGGRIERARVLATDHGLAERRAAFASVPQRVDGTGATAARLMDELIAQVEGAAAAIEQRHAVEVADTEARIKRFGERGSGKRRLEERHKRELRRHRTDELLAGLAATAGTYRDALAAGLIGTTDGVEAVERIHSAMAAFEYNPNEQLLLQSLLWGLPALRR